MSEGMRQRNAGGGGEEEVSLLSREQQRAVINEVGRALPPHRRTADNDCTQAHMHRAPTLAQTSLSPQPHRPTSLQVSAEHKRFISYTRGGIAALATVLAATFALAALLYFGGAASGHGWLVPPGALTFGPALSVLLLALVAAAAAALALQLAALVRQGNAEPMRVSG